jgi:integrase
MQAKITTRLIKSLSPRQKPYDVFDTDLTGFLLRIQPSGYLCYYFAYKTRGGQGKRLRIGPTSALTVAQARDLAEQYAARVTTGEDVQATKQQEREDEQNARFQTLAGFLEYKYGPWLLAERPEKRRSLEVLQRLRANFADVLARPLTEITPWLIEKWRAEQRKRGKAVATLNRDVTVLRSVLSKAVMWHVIDHHPLGDLKPLKVDTHGSIRYLTTYEEARLRTALTRRDAQLKAARARGNAWRRIRGYQEMPSLDRNAYGDHLTPMVLLSLNTGLRRGEIFALRWQDVNIHTKSLTVRGETAKSGRTRHIPLNAEAMLVLQAWRQQSADSALVFPGKNGGQFDNTRKAWDGVLKVADIIGFRWHDLRHTFASNLVMAGVPLNTVRELLGHTTPTMTLRYAHLAPDHKAAAVERLSRPPSSDAAAMVLGHA